MITTAQQKQRMNQLIRLDNADEQEEHAYFASCLAYVRDHIMTFYQHYATDNGLTLDEVSKRVSSWDLEQWKRAIESMDTSDWPREARERARIYGIVAGIDRKHMLTSIIGLGILGLTVKHLRQIDKRVAYDMTDELSRMQTLQKLTPNQVKTVRKVISPEVKKMPWSANLWLDHDSMVNDVENLVHKHVVQGKSLKELEKGLIYHTNPKQFKPNKSIADRIAQSSYNTQRLVRSESAKVVDKINMESYKRSGIRYVNWLTEPGTCVICAGFASDSPYLIEDAPMVVVDTHPNCRCLKVPTNEAP